jgi:hypothetical protein
LPLEMILLCHHFPLIPFRLSKNKKSSADPRCQPSPEKGSRKRSSQLKEVKKARPPILPGLLFKRKKVTRL